MIRVRVLRQMGRALAAPLSAEFDAAGGTIGRSPDCTLVLPDQGKHISRQQARIEHRDGQFSIVALGTANPLIVDGRELTAGASAPLRGGEAIVIAHYELSVERAGAPPPASAPAVASPAGDDGFDPFAPPAHHRVAAPKPPSVAACPAIESSLVDPFAPPAALGSLGADQGSSDSAADPFAVSPQRPIDPFAPIDATNDAGSATGADLFGIGGRFAPALDANRRQAEDIGALFGLDSVESGRDPLHDGSTLGEAARAAEPLDPLEAIAGRKPAARSKAPPADALPMHDHAPIEHGAMRLPDVIPPTMFGAPSSPSAASANAPAGPPASAAASAEPAAAISSASLNRSPAPSDTAPAKPHVKSAPSIKPLPPNQIGAARIGGDAVLSWERTADAQASPRLSDQEVRAIAERVADQHPRDFEPPPQTQPTLLIDQLNAEQRRALASASDKARALRQSAGDAAPAQPGVSPSDTELLIQFLIGAGFKQWPRADGSADTGAMLTPQVMRRLGEMLRLSAQGVVDLLTARALIKRELKADVTMITAHDNNPLKFAPDGASALAQLLAEQPLRGFMPGPAALKDAFDDLRAHQLAMVAGMRAAMQGLSARFDPATLEERLSKQNLLHSMMPIARRARLWELFIERYTQLSSEAADDFDALFGQAFVNAYQQQIDKLEQDQAGR